MLGEKPTHHLRHRAGQGSEVWGAQGCTPLSWEGGTGPAAAPDGVLTLEPNDGLGGNCPAEPQSPSPHCPAVAGWAGLCYAPAAEDFGEGGGCLTAFGGHGHQGGWKPESNARWVLTCLPPACACTPWQKEGVSPRLWAPTRSLASQTAAPGPRGRQGGCTAGALGAKPGSVWGSLGALQRLLEPSMGGPRFWSPTNPIPLTPLPAWTLSLPRLPVLAAAGDTHVSIHTDTYAHTHAHTHTNMHTCATRTHRNRYVVTEEPEEQVSPGRPFASIWGRRS